MVEKYRGFFLSSSVRSVIVGREEIKLESLANELLLELFEFFDGIQILRAFHGLNCRFDTLLFVHFQHYRLDFRSVSKSNFDLVLGQSLPLITSRVISLCLPDHDETPNLVNHFLAYGFTLNQFTHLQSLSLFHIDSIEIINTILNESTFLSQLTHLTLTKCCAGRTNGLINLINTIWRLPTLKYCDLGRDIIHQTIFSKLTTISCSIQFVSVPLFRFYLKDLINLFKHTPRLRHLDATLFSDLGVKSLLPQVASSMAMLNIIVIATDSAMISLFRNTPNLRILMIDTSNAFLNGYAWQQIIVDHLPRIEVFRLHMEFKFLDENIREKQTDELLETFRTSFWLEKHRWFVRCEWNLCIEDDTIALYTLPYYLDRFNIRNQIRRFKSTHPDDRAYLSYDSVHNFNLESNIENWCLLPFHFSNLRSLNINLPTHSSIYSLIPILDHLTSLTAILNDYNAQSELQVLLNRAPRLYSLTVILSLDLLPILSKITSASVRRLDVSHCSSFDDLYLNASQCSALISSSLGRQCEVFSINLQDRWNALDLIKTKSNIRTLICLFQEDNIGLLSSEKDELVGWLQEHLPSMSSIRRTGYPNNRIELWICQ